MAMPRGLKKLLQTPAVLHRYAGVDDWGNTSLFPPEDLMCFLDQENAAYGEKKIDDVVVTNVRTLPVYTDALDIKVNDIIEFEYVEHTVTGVTTIRNKQGIPVAQILETTTK